MGNLSENIGNLIMESMKSRDSIRTGVLRLIRAKILEARVAKGRKEKGDLTESEEITVLLKISNERKDSIEAFRNAGRDDLVKSEELELSIISEFLPEAPDTQEVKDFLESIWTEGSTMKDMGKYVKFLKEKFPTLDGKTISGLVKDRIG